MKDYFNIFNKNKYTLFQTKTEIFPKNKNTQAQKIHYNYNPTFPKNTNYNNTDQNFFPYNTNLNNINNINQYVPNNPQGPTYIPFNVINNNISSNDRIYQKYFYIADRNNTLNNYNNSHANTTFHRNYDKILDSQYKEERTRSPIPDIIEKENYDFLIKERLKNKRKNYLNENKYGNKSTEVKFYNRALLSRSTSNFYSDNKKDNILGQKNKTYLNIYRNKIVQIFVKIINKVIERYKKKEIMKNFFYNLKKSYYKNRIKINYLNDKYNKDDPKYNEYKDMIYNYIKSKNDLPMIKIYNILKPEDKFKFNTINSLSKTNSKFRPKEESISNNTSSRTSQKFNEMQRFRQLQKKYGKIYEKKKNESISFEDKIKNYINQKTIDSTSSNNTDNDIFRKNIIFKRVRKNNKEYKKLNKTEEKRENNNISSNDIYNNNSSNIKYIKEYKSKPIEKRRRMNSQSSYKSIKSTNDNKNRYKIYIVKNIVSSDKRIFVNINYINLSDKDKKSDKKYYSNDMLEISDVNEINYLGNNNNKNNNAKHKKKLSKIEEEIDDKINTNLSISIKENNNKNIINENQDKKEETNPKSMKRIINNNRINNNLTAKFRKKYLYYKNLNKPDKNE